MCTAWCASLPACVGHAILPIINIDTNANIPNAVVMGISVNCCCNIDDYIQFDYTQPPFLPIIPRGYPHIGRSGTTVWVHSCANDSVVDLSRCGNATDCIIDEITLLYHAIINIVNLFIHQYCIFIY